MLDLGADVHPAVQMAAAPSVFALSEGGATSATARYMAQHENGADLIGATSLLNDEEMALGSEG